MKHHQALYHVFRFLSFLIALIFFTYENTPVVLADQTCRVVDARFVPNSNGGIVYDNPPAQVTIEATTISCIDGQDITFTVVNYREITNTDGTKRWELFQNGSIPGGSATTKIINNTAQVIFDTNFSQLNLLNTERRVGFRITIQKKGIVEGSTYISEHSSTPNEQVLILKCTSSNCSTLKVWKNITPPITVPEPTSKFFYKIHPQSALWTQGGGAQGEMGPDSEMFDTFAECQTSRSAHLVREDGTEITLSGEDQLLYGSCRRFDTGTGTESLITLDQVDTNDPCYDDASNTIDPTCYTFIEPLPGLTKISSADGLGKYVNTLFQIAIGLLGVLAVTMITVAGFTYMTTDSASAKEDAKKRIGGAIFGLILALGIFILLGTINPNLLKVVPEIPKVNLTFDTSNYDSDATATVTQFTLPQDIGLYCPKPATGNRNEIKKIVDSFIGKTTYRYGGKGGDLPPNTVFGEKKPEHKTCPTDTVCLDCSGFVNHVINCAGFTPPGGGTANIFASNSQIISSISENQNQVTINGNYVLQPGDLVGFPSTGNKVGHVWIYVGNGVFAESNGSGRSKGDGVKTGRNITNIKASAERAGFRLYLRKIQ